MYVKKNIPPGPKRQDSLKRFMKYVSIPEDKSLCWKWNGKKDRKGYGQFYHYKEDGKPYRPGAHRVAYMLLKSPIDHGKIVCHKCDVPDCVNPAHLFIGTYKDNVADMDSKGRRVAGGAKGEENKQHKVSAMQVLEIRRIYSEEKYSQEQIASFYGLRQTQVSRIIRGESWKHLQSREKCMAKKEHHNERRS